MWLVGARKDGKPSDVPHCACGEGLLALAKAIELQAQAIDRLALSLVDQDSEQEQTQGPMLGLNGKPII